jgi:acyl transferase domain-containing protein
VADNREDRDSTGAAGPDDIAVVGIGCQYAGGVHDLDSLWQVVLDGRDVTSEVPPDRWDARFLDKDRAEGTMYCGRGGFLDDVDTFDARFFGITPREAAEIDPQHRLLLRTAWAAMEDTGVPRDRWEGSRTGVFTGILGMDYTLLHAKTAGPAGVGPYYASGKEASFGAGRIAYTFGLHGPCMMLNSACSSSLLAVHLASQALRAGECDAALAGGVNLMLAPELSIFMSRIEALSPTETSRPFDAAADGVVRGEGCGMVVLKRYADAAAAGDRVYAVLKGSATVHDGHSAGLIAPNAEAQQMLLEAALTAAGVSAADIDYVETHCTGTPLGDRLEVSALATVLGARRDPGRPLLIGSHKANFGHTDSASGVLGLLKGILVARHGTVPPQINVDTPMDLLVGGGVRVATEPTALPGDGPRHVGVSAFGLSGTNVHVVVASPPDRAATGGTGAGAGASADAGASEREPLPVLLVSGPTPEAMAAQAAAYRDVVAATGEDGLQGLLHNASVRRTHHDYRLAVTGTTGPGLAAALDAHLAGETAGAGASASGDVLGGRAPRIVHAFSGQGSQWPGMAMDVYRAQPVVRDALDECDALIRRFTDWSLLQEIGRTRESRLTRTEIAQPAIFAVQLALSRLWTSWGLAPTAVVGHSVGEIAAAHTAGTIGLEDAVRLVVARGRIMQGATGSGRMTQVELPADQVQAALRPLGGEVVLATVNGPHSVVVAGPADAMERAVAHLKRTGATCLPLGVDYAFHSPAVHEHGDELESLLAGLTPEAPRIPLLSSVDPEAAAPVTDASYWGRNVRDTVRFWPAVDRRLAARDALFIEIGPHPVLSRPLRDALAHRRRSGAVVPSLARGKSGPLTLAASLATLHTIGAPVDWRAVHPARGGHLTLPPVPLAKERYWLPGLARGEQGGPSAAGATVSVAGLRAEVRLFDADRRLVAAIENLAVTPAAAGAPAAASPVTATSPVPAAVPPAAAAPAAPMPREALGQEQTAKAVGRIAAEVLGVPGHRLSRIRGFYELGFDSFSIVELVTRLRTEFGVELPAGAGLDHPSIAEMTDFILGEAAAPAGAAAAASAAGSASDGGSESAAEPAAAVGPASAAGLGSVAGPEPAAGPAGTARVVPVPVVAEAVAAPAAVRVPGVVPEPEPEPAASAPGERDAEAIAVVGMGCRLPGAVGLDAYWSLLAGGVDATGEVPDDRWNAAALLDRSGGQVAPGNVSTGRGAFIEGIDRFDNAFFRVSAREARSMDPQQRIFLEVAWEALEDAGLSAEALRGGRTGLFVGLNTTDYGQMLSRDPEQVDLYYGTGNTFSGSAGRMSYFLGVRGPSVAVDTACASSLTAVHLGCQSLRSGESEVVVAGGSNALLTPTVYQAMSAGGALAADGRCKTFDASADGYGRGEGAGAVVLKTLSRARADGDRVYAVIRGSAVNHNGASGGLTVPSADAQAEVITTALAQGGVDPAAVDYVEAHGTGTPLGDPIELTALDRVLGAARPDGPPLLVGSVKTNIAHLEAAAGVAGLIKTVLALWHRQIPPHLHFRQPSPQVAWDRLRLRVAAGGAQWPAAGDRPRTAGVSAFGFTGTNAHVVLSEPPPPPVPSPTPAGSAAAATAATDRAYALAVSAASPAALEQAAERVAARLETAADAELADLCHTLGVRRSHLEHRLVAVGAGRAAIVAALRAVTPAETASGTARVGEPTPFAAVFGTSVADLPWERLYAAEPAFAAALDTAEAAALAVLGVPVRTALQQRRTDPVTTVAAQIALAALWADLGVRPDALVGRGPGEIAAAHVAGVLGLRDAMAAAGGMPGVRLSGAPGVPLYLASLHPDAPSAPAGPLTAWTPPAAACPVAFGPALAGRLAAEGVETVLDTGLAGAAAELAAVCEELTAVTLTGAPDPAALVRAAAALHATGSRLDWSALLAGRGTHVSAPGYPWQHRRHWIDVPAAVPAGAPVAMAAGEAAAGAGAHPALGAPVVPYDAPGARYYPVRRSEGAGEPLAAPAMTALLLAAGRDLLGDGPVELHDVHFGVPLIAAAALAPAAGAQLAARRSGAGWSLSLVPGGATGPAASAVLTRPADQPPEPTDLTALRDRLSGAVTERLESFRLPTGTAALPESLLAAASALLATCLPGHSMVVARTTSIRIFLPPTDEVLLHAAADTGDTGRIRILTSTGHVLAELLGVHYLPTAAPPIDDRIRRRVADRLYTVRWQPTDLPQASGSRRPADLPTAALTGVGADARHLDGLPADPADGPAGPEAVARAGRGLPLGAVDQAGSPVGRPRPSAATPSGRQPGARGAAEADGWAGTATAVDAVTRRADLERVSVGPWAVVAATARDGEGARGVAAAFGRAGLGARVVEVGEWSALLGEGTAAGVVVVAVAETPEGSAGGDAAGVTLEVARAAVRAKVPPRVWLVTRGAQDPDGGLPPDRGQAAAWGLVRVLAMEAPQAWGGCVDLPDRTPREYDAAVARLAAQVREPGRTAEDELCLRDGTWYVPRLVRAQAPPEPPVELRCRRDGWYVVVGALTAAVRPVVDRLVAAGARRLLVVRPRTGEGAAGPDTGWAEEMSLAGVDVKVVDLADSDDGGALAGATGGEPIAGVLVAPVPRPVRPLSATEPAELAAGQALAGTAARLESALRGRRLDFFHVLGSAAASWGSAGMAASGALDGALAAVAAARRAGGQPAAVIRWMPRADTGELTRRDRLMMENSGLVPLTADDLTEAVDLLLRGGYADAAVARVDEERYAAVCREQTARGFLDLLGRPAVGPATGDGTEPVGADAPDAPPALVGTLLALSPQLRGDVLLDTVLRHVTDVLGEDAGGEVDPDRGFFELGMDSVMAVALKTRLDDALGVDLPATLTFEFPTGRALARYLLEGLGDPAGPDTADGHEENAAPLPGAAGTVAGAPAADQGDGLEDLSDDELMERLMAGLATSEQLLGQED